MFADTRALDFFTTFVWSHELLAEDRERINVRLRRKLAELMAGAAGDRPRQGWQTAQDLHTLPEFQELNRFILAAAQGALDFLQADGYEGFEITGCWANISPPGANHPPHQHPNNYLGGVYYVDVPEGAGTITFYDPRPQTHLISPRVTASTNFNAGRVHVEVKEGLLLVFPSWLVHSVVANPADRNRISISFNIMFSSFTGTMSPTKWDGNIPTQ